MKFRKFLFQPLVIVFVDVQAFNPIIALIGDEKVKNFVFESSLQNEAYCQEVFHRS